MPPGNTMCSSKATIKFIGAFNEHMKERDGETIVKEETEKEERREQSNLEDQRKKLILWKK